MTVREARIAYNAGTHELCQGADEDFFYLYAIPRWRRVTRKEKHKLPVWPR